MGFLLAVLGLFFPVIAFSDNYQITPEYLQTSDNFYFSKMNIDYSGFRSDTWWPYVNEPENGAGWTAHASILQADTPQDNLSSYSLELGIHNKRSVRNSWTLRVGLIQVNENGRDEYLDTLFFIQSKGSWTNTSWYSIEASKEYLFMERLILSGQQDQTRSYNVKPSFLYNGWKRQRVFFRGHYSQMDHDNLRMESDVQWMYGVSQYKPWLWLGIGANHASYSEQQSGYWSPENFLSYGPRSEAAYNWERWQISAGFNYSRHKEDNFDEGEGFYTTLSIQYGRRESNHIRLSGEAMESAQGSSAWRASTIRLESLMEF